MSGHSKWSQIKRDKAQNDSKRSQVFTKIAKALTVAAKKGGSDPDANPTLRLALEKAKDARMPKDVIDRAIAKAVGGTDSAEFTEIIYEGYGPGGEAFYVKTLTDNRNRTVAEVRNIFSRHGGSLGNSGSTAYIFGTDPENPIFSTEVSPDGLEKLLLIVEDLEDLEDIQDVYFNFDIPENQQ